MWHVQITSKWVPRACDAPLLRRISFGLLLHPSGFGKTSQLRGAPRALCHVRSQASFLFSHLPAGLAFHSLSSYHCHPLLSSVWVHLDISLTCLRVTAPHWTVILGGGRDLIPGLWPGAGPEQTGPEGCAVQLELSPPLWLDSSGFAAGPGVLSLGKPLTPSQAPLSWLSSCFSADTPGESTGLRCTEEAGPGRG